LLSPDIDERAAGAEGEKACAMAAGKMVRSSETAPLAGSSRKKFLSEQIDARVNPTSARNRAFLLESGHTVVLVEQHAAENATRRSLRSRRLTPAAALRAGVRSRERAQVHFAVRIAVQHEHRIRAQVRHRESQRARRCPAASVSGEYMRRIDL
jgi:hypothetical protein